jgi:hypothetical protein
VQQRLRDAEIASIPVNSVIHFQEGLFEAETRGAARVIETLPARGECRIQVTRIDYLGVGQSRRPGDQIVLGANYLFRPPELN